MSRRINIYSCYKLAFHIHTISLVYTCEGVCVCYGFGQTYLEEFKPVQEVINVAAQWFQAGIRPLHPHPRYTVLQNAVYHLLQLCRHHHWALHTHTHTHTHPARQSQEYNTLHLLG